MKILFQTILGIILFYITTFSSLFAREGDQISIVGSSTVFPFATIAAERFAKNTDFKAPVIESTGSGGGLKLFCAGIGLDYPDITNSSRAIKSSEKENCAAAGITPVEYLVGYDGITFSNSKQAKKFSLTKEEIYKAVSAKVMTEGKMIKNPFKLWSDINPELPKVEIDVLAPPPSSGTRDAFVELVMHSTCKKIYKMPKKGTDGYKENCSSLREEGASKNRFGIFGFSFLDQNNDKVQGSIVDGVSPNIDTIADGSYGVSRPLFFYVKKEHVGVIPGIQEYADYFMTLAKSGGPLEDAGLISAP